jgi:hypothetical protein
MALSFEKLIQDVQGFPDALELPVTIGSGESATTDRIRLGDIRGQLGNTLGRYEADRQLKEQQIATLEQTLRSLREAPNAGADGNRQVTPGPAGVPSDDELNSDPWSKALRAQIQKDLEAKLESVRGEFNGFADTSRGGVKALTSLLLNLKAENDFNRLKDWPKEYDPAKAFQEAANRHYLDKNGLPDLSRLHHDLTEDQRIEARAKALAEKMFEDRQKAEAEKNVSRFNKLGVPSSIRSKQNKQERKYNTLQEYMMDDANLPTDDEIRAAGGILNAIR